MIELFLMGDLDTDQQIESILAILIFQQAKQIQLE